MNTLDALSISLGGLMLVRFLGMLVFIDLYLQKREMKYFVLILGWLAAASGSAWGLYSHAVLGAMENHYFSLLAGIGSFWIGCGALLYFDAIRPRFLHWGSILILLYGLLPLVNVNLGASPGVIVQVLVSCLVTFVVLFRRKVFWAFARSSYLWLAAMAVLSVGLTFAFGVGVIGQQNLPIGFVGTTFIHIIAIVFFLHLEYNQSARKILESQNRYRILSEQLEEKVIERTRALEEAQENLIRKERLAGLGELANLVGQELRNPLAVITNAAYYLQMTLPDLEPKNREHLSLIDAETKNASQTINDLLDFGRIRSAHPSPTRMSELVNVVISQHPAPENVTLEVHIPADFPPVPLDSQQIEQAIGHLVMNAYQAMPEGGQLSIAARLESPQRLVIAIADTGVGMSPETLTNVFQPLYTTRAKSFGLGLAIVRMLVEGHDGTIEAKSVGAPGKGSTFTISLPLLKP
jgi:signal transduction histidine kinase